MAAHHRQRIRVLLGVGLLVLVVAWPAVRERPAAAAAAPVQLLGQSATVLAAPTGTSPFDLLLAMPAGSSVSTTLYGAISTRSGFEAALSATGPTGQIATTAPVPAACLSPTTDGGRRLTIDVLTGTGSPSPSPCQSGASQPSWSLRCTVGSGACNGVYPVAVTVTTGTDTVGRFTTFLTFVEQPARQPLRVAVVASLGQATTTRDVAALTGALRRQRAVPLDVAVSPAGVAALGETAAATHVLAGLARVVGDSDPAHELVRTPFVTVDPGQLSASGLTDQIHRQLARGERTLRSVGLDGATPAAGWLATSPVTSSTTTGLSAARVEHLVVPDSSLASPTSTSLEWGEPFTLSPGTSSITALAADALLSSQMAAGTQPVLAAERLLADLAFLHFERPSLSMPQGVVVEPPVGWHPDGTFLDTLLAGLRDDPVVSPSTVSNLFAQLTPGSNGSPTSRQLATTTPSSSWPASQVNQLRTGQAGVRSFAAGLSGGSATTTALALGWLRAEADTLTIATRPTALGDAQAALDAQFAGVGISGGDITLTSLKSSLPVTLTKAASWNLRGVLLVKGDHLVFPDGDRSVVLIDHPTQSVRLPVEAQTTGDLTVTATLTTPDGAVVITHARIVVHTTQTSVVAILLTAGAAIVLGMWWLRTWRRDRRERRT